MIRAIIAGRGTTALELLEDVRFARRAAGVFGRRRSAGGLRPCRDGTGAAHRCVWRRAGGGRRLGAVAGIAARSSRSRCRDTIADGQQTQAPGALTWPIVRALVRGGRDGHRRRDSRCDEIRVRTAEARGRAERCERASGPLDWRVDLRGKRVGVTISGGNVDPQIFAEAIGW
jgi:threonine dehydratase